MPRMMNERNSVSHDGGLSDLMVDDMGDSSVYFGGSIQASR